MKFNKSMSLVASLVLASTVFIGCSSSTDETPSDAVTVLTGTFIDAPVQGLKYITSTQSGYTDANGEFNYVAGESVEFLLGNLSFGSVSAGELITPYTLGDSNASSPSTITTNITLLLQNFDVNRSNASALDLSNLQEYSFSDINLSATATEMESTINTLLSTATFQVLVDENNNSLIENTTALATMNTYLSQFSTEFLEGKTFYAFINDSGTIIILTVSFDATNISFEAVKQADGTVVFSGGATYTVTDGVLHWSDDTDGPQQWNIVSISSESIIVPAETTIANGIDQNETLTLYYNEADMQTALSAQ